MQNTITATSVLVALVSIIFSLATMAELQKQTTVAKKAERALYSESLKREYFEWRESNAIGHTESKTAFPRYKELEAVAPSGKEAK